MELDQKFKRVLSPRALAKYPHLSKPDTKFNSDGVYHVGLLLNPENPGVAEFLALLDEGGEIAMGVAREEISKEKNPAKRKQKLDTLQLHPPYMEEYDDDGNATGFVLVQAKSYATRTDKKTGDKTTCYVEGVDANCKKIDLKQLRIGNGTVMKVVGSLKPSYVAGTNKASVSFYMAAVQIIDLVEFTGGGAAGAFEAEDGGFDGSEYQSAAPAVRSYADDLPKGYTAAEDNGDDALPF